MTGVTLINKTPNADQIIGQARPQKAPGVVGPNPLNVPLMGPTTDKPLKVSGSSEVSLTLGDSSGQVIYKPGTDKRPSVIYASPEMMIAIAKSCLLAQGCDPDTASDRSSRTMEAVYHGGNPILDDAGIRVPCLIINAEVRNGAKLAHGLGHVKGGNELEAREAEKKYLERNNISSELPPLSSVDYPNPGRRDKPIIEFSLGIGPVGGGGYYRRPIRPLPKQQQPVKAPAPAPIAPSTQVGRGSAASMTPSSQQSRSGIDPATKGPELANPQKSQLEIEQRNMWARAVRGLLGFFGLSTAPQLPRPEPTKEEGIIENKVGPATSSGFGGSASGQHRGQGQPGQGRKPQAYPQQKDGEQGQ